jgi:hypothetical protein
MDVINKREILARTPIANSTFLTQEEIFRILNEQTNNRNETTCVAINCKSAELASGGLKIDLSK